MISREQKGAPLSHTELDNNFAELANNIDDNFTELANTLILYDTSVEVDAKIATIPTTDFEVV